MLKTGIAQRKHRLNIHRLYGVSKISTGYNVLTAVV